MEQLPTHIKTNILGFIPRRVHPSAIIMREAINVCVRHWDDVLRFSPWMRLGIDTGIDDMWGATWYKAQILAPYKDKFECRECDCCGELLADCQCMCDCGDDYQDCTGRCCERNDRE